MERSLNPTADTPVERQLAHLKVVSRLLGHELHAQAGPRITVSRDELTEVQTCIDLFIEGMLRRRGGAPQSLAGVEPETVPARVN